ncbi:MAG: DUF3109 family protein [Bacteroidota bacterium]
MFAIDHVLVSDALLDAPFACHLGRCLGGCCVHGDRGAPLEPDERAELERALPVVARDLRPEALRVIDEQGVWVEEEPGHYGTSCVDGRECVFVVYEGKVAKCALQQAYHAGRLDFEKPVSCHLFPVRIEPIGGTDVLNYEQIGLCKPAVRHGRRRGTQLYDFLRKPLTRKYGAAWYEQFRTACAERAAILFDTA